MFDKAIATLALLLALLQSAQADPVKLLSRWERALILEGQILNATREVFQKKQAGQLSETYDECARRIGAILAVEAEPLVLQQVAHMALFAKGDTEDRFVNDCKEASFFSSVNLMSQISTAESLKSLRNFRMTESLDGGYSLTVDEAILRLEKTLQAPQ